MILFCCVCHRFIYASFSSRLIELRSKKSHRIHNDGKPVILLECYSACFLLVNFRDTWFSVYEL